MNMDTKALFVAVLAAGIVGGFVISDYLVDDEAIEQEETLEEVEVGNEAPDFTLIDTDGNEFNLSDYEGKKVIVLEFMSMKCGTCKNFEKDTIKNYHNESMPESVEVISVTQTKNADNNELAERSEEMGWRFMKGSSEMTDAFGAESSPTIVIIDKDGMVTFSESGIMSQSELEEEVNAALG
jgi:thioredoxin-related protein